MNDSFHFLFDFKPQIINFIFVLKGDNSGNKRIGMICSK